MKALHISVNACRNIVLTSISLCVGLLFFNGFAASTVHAEKISVTIGTGSVAGVYYPTGKAIAKIVNNYSSVHGIQVGVESTGGSVFNVNAIDAMQACGIDWRSDLSAEGIRTDSSAKLLQDGKVDAFFYTVGHPNVSIKEATEGDRKAHFVPLASVCIDQLVAKWPYYAKAVIPVRFYPRVRNKGDVETFGVKATFCTSIDIPDKIVYIITREIFENLDEFKMLHPAYGTLTKDNMLEALSAPIHPGAMKYYKEAGLKTQASLPTQ